MAFVKAIVGDLPISRDYINIAVVEFSDTAYLQFNLNQYFSVSEVQSAIDNIPYIGSLTNIAEALTTVRQNIFTYMGGDRQNAANIVLLITDGRSNVRENEVLQEGSMLKQQNQAKLIVVGISSSVDSVKLRQLSSNAYIEVSSFENLMQIVSDITDAICA